MSLDILLKYASNRSPNHVFFVASHLALANAKGAGITVDLSMLPNLLGWFGIEILVSMARRKDRPKGLGKKLSMVMERSGFENWISNEFTHHKLCEQLGKDDILLHLLRLGKPDKAEKILDSLKAAGCENMFAVEDAYRNHAHPFTTQALMDQQVIQGARKIIKSLTTKNLTDWGEYSSEAKMMFDEIGALMEDLGDTKGAQAAYEQVLKIQKAASGALPQDLAETTYNLGAMMVENQNYAQALEKLSESLSLYQTFLEHYDPRLALVLNSLGDALAGLGEKKTAHQNFSKALTIIEQKLSENHPFVRDLWFKMTLIENEIKKNTGTNT